MLVLLSNTVDIAREGCVVAMMLTADGTLEEANCWGALHTFLELQENNEYEDELQFGIAVWGSACLSMLFGYQRASVTHPVFKLILIAMEKVRKTFFDPLASSKGSIRALLEDLPVGSAHPFSPEKILLCRTEDGIIEIDISSYPEDFFFNAVDLGEMGEVLLRRMAGFKGHLGVFDDFQITQAPASTFRVPIVSGQIAMLAVSKRTPTYYDFCFANEQDKICCWNARNTFPGIAHSGDINNGKDFLAHVKLNNESLTNETLCVFISGYQSTKITRFLGTHPALLVADHADKILYIVPVPLDAATIGDASLCCPLVVQRDRDSLICSVLPTATTDTGKMASGASLVSPCFPEAIRRADFTISAPAPVVASSRSESTMPETTPTSKELHGTVAKENAIIATNAVALPAFVDSDQAQIIVFGTGLEFKSSWTETSNTSAVVLPCIFGSQLGGPPLLATGTIPYGVPFDSESDLRNYYAQLKNIVVLVDERMTDNARNLASRYRLNALFIVQINPQTQPQSSDEILSILNSANINAVTALAGPQSLVLISIHEKYYFYRGLADLACLDTSRLAFGADVTSVVESAGLNPLIDLRAERLVNLDNENSIILPRLGKFVKPGDLQGLLENLTVDEIKEMDEDISAITPQLQSLLSQKDLQELSKSLVSTLSTKISSATAPLRKTYLKFITREHEFDDPEFKKQKDQMLGQLRKRTKQLQEALEPVISSLANMMSSQTSSKRTHDLKRLARQAQIQSNVDAVKTMTFETVAGYLEEHASEMGVMLLNIETDPYLQILSNLQGGVIDASTCCELDSRILHLEGLDAGIIMEQSQNHHDGPLRSQAGPAHPILALPYLSQGKGTYGSMLALVCWDEFVNLKTPYKTRWMEKCNEPHIAALRIIARDTLSQAVASREYNFAAASPEMGHLMSALLMASMSKLAAMRSTMPAVSSEAEDTVTKLMRGLFGNLLTVAGSGVRPLSMVWQLFGLDPQWDVPKTNSEWTWYETVVSLYPYTGWPVRRFHQNLEILLDRVIVRAVVKAETVKDHKGDRISDMVKSCKLRNIQLEHSRTIITVFMHMLTKEDVDPSPIAARLLERLPQKLERETESYTRMIDYLRHLAEGGQRRASDDLIAASVYTKRSAAFADFKNKAAAACVVNDWPEAKKCCQDLIDEHARIAALWQVKPKSLKVQNMKVYQAFLKADSEEGGSSNATIAYHGLTRQILNDAERSRVPWQVGKEGQFSDKIEPLDEAFVEDILTGVPVDSETISKAIQPAPTSTALTEQTPGDFRQFGSSLQSSFVTAMENATSPEDACKILSVSASAMRVFVKALNPQFEWDSLSHNFKAVMLWLVKNRSSRIESRPVRKLLNLDALDVKEEVVLQIEGIMRLQHLGVVALASAATASSGRIIIDNDWNLNGYITFLLAVEAGWDVLGLIGDTANSWARQSSFHALALLEIGNLSCIPVHKGADYPLLNTPELFQVWEMLHGAFGPENATAEANGQDPSSGDPNRIVPAAFKAGYPNATLAGEHAAAWMVEQVRKYPGEVLIYSGGALTNIALATRLDPKFASLTRGLVVMGGYLDLSQLTASGSREAADITSDINLKMDPEAAKISLNAPFPNITVVGNGANQYVPDQEYLGQVYQTKTRYTSLFFNEYGTQFPMWDELAIFAGIYPEYVTNRSSFHIDVDVAWSSPYYGNVIAYQEDLAPKAQKLQRINYIESVDVEALKKAMKSAMNYRNEETWLLIQGKLDSITNRD
ncbi:hypothetical protein HJFPF1_13161 [Paramyrothecium foliicola]|nr:hypothetical protein HJFPF1_13161 [Paramyrothecium foliicola]